MIKSYPPLNNQFLAATSSTKIPVASGHYLAMTGNSIPLPAGTTWDITGVIRCRSNGSTLYDYVLGVWTIANGVDSGVEPTPLVPIANPDRSILGGASGSPDFAEVDFPINIVRYVTTTNISVFLVPYVQMTTASNSRVTTFIYARQIS